MQELRRIIRLDQKRSSIWTIEKKKKEKKKLKEFPGSGCCLLTESSLADRDASGEVHCVARL